MSIMFSELTYSYCVPRPIVGPGLQDTHVAPSCPLATFLSPAVCPGGSPVGITPKVTLICDVQLSLANGEPHPETGKRKEVR